MTEQLLVHFETRRVGVLERWRFAYDEGWLTDGWPLSVSLPLRPDPFTDAAQHWFDNLLPEGRARDHLAQRFRIDPTDAFALLVRLGGECAGALTLDAEPLSANDRPSVTYRQLTETELEDMAVAGVPAVFGERTRLSLAGAQSKIAVRRFGTALELPQGNAPSTHILKLPSTDDAALVENELLALRLSERLGLPTVAAEPFPLGAHRGLLVERYDRRVSTRHADERSLVERVHQEDLVQATGRPRQLKYEQSGGFRFSEAVDLVRRTALRPTEDIQLLLRWFAFCFVVGNRDNHAKNLSRLLEPSVNRWTLAPFYDLVNTTAYRRLDRRLAMFVAGEAEPNRLSRASWEAFARELAVSPRLVIRVLSETREAVEDVLADVQLQVAGELGDAQRLFAFVRAIRKASRLAAQSLQ